MSDITQIRIGQHITGKVMAVGSVPSRGKIKTWVVHAAQKASSTYKFGK